MSDTRTLCYFTYGTSAGHYHYALNVLKGLHDADPHLDINVFYAGTDHQSQFPDYTTERHFVYTGSDSTVSMIVRTLLLQVQLVLYLLWVRPDVVHMNTQLRTQWYTLYVTILAACLRIPVVRTVHERTDERLGTVHPLARVFSDSHLQLSDHLFVHTQAAREALLADGITTPSSVVRHGHYRCFRQHIDDHTTSPYGETDGPLVLFFGVKEHKGIDLFLEALNHTETAVEPWVVGPVNDGDEAYADRARRDDRVRTHFEFVPDDRLWAYFHFADIVALPYHSGTTSGGLQLALAFENAVLVSSLPCFTEYVTDGETAAVVDPLTPERFAARLDTLVADPERRRCLATAGYEHTHTEQFDWGHIARRTLDVYDRA